ncbi:MAG: gfo/Idh/MocA family oxidoreductase [Hyphomicrobiales bacterium]|nr:gfo/Idh/MocA family oxidoreductase [Hyphomicrobiales bacterium]
MKTSLNLSRRGVVVAGCAGLASLAGGPAHAQSPPAREPLDVGGVQERGLKFDPIAAATEPAQKPKPGPLPPAERVGFAIAGLGRLAGEEVIPAFGECRRSRIAALVSGSPEKAAAVGKSLGLGTSALYDYESFDRIADDPSVQVVYVITPNALHKDLVIRAARAKKHVLCEKPMATSSADAREMIEACDRAGVKLMIAYRSQYQKHHRRLLGDMRSGRFGTIKMIEAVNVQAQGDVRQWRLRKALAGGGSLPDIGLYCLNEARFLTGEEPVEISAQIYSTPGDPRFAEVEESVAFTLRFPSGVLASCSTSYGAHKSQHLLVNGERGWARMDKAFAYRGQALHIGSVENGAEVVETVGVEVTNQFADEIDHMAQCVLEGRVPRTPGQEGLQDHVLMEAIYEAARTGQTVKLGPGGALDATRGPPLGEPG